MTSFINSAPISWMTPFIGSTDTGGRIHTSSPMVPTGAWVMSSYSSATLDSMEIACLYASHGVLGVKANKICGQDAQNAQGEQVAHLWTYMFLFKEEPYIEAFKHFLLGTGNFFQL